MFGALVLAAFLLYGIGSASAERPLGMSLVVLNSFAVAYLGAIGFRLLRPSDRIAGAGYLAARIAEATLLVGGIVLAQRFDFADADTAGYLLAMIFLGIGSIPFCRSLGRDRWIPQALATGGTYAYAALAIGSLVELATGWSVAIVFAAPGALFEIALGIYLIRHGFNRPSTTRRS